MARVILDNGVVLDFDEQVFRVASPAAPPAARRGASLFDETPRLITPTTAAPSESVAAQHLVGRLVARGVVARADAPINLAAGTQTAAAGRRAAPPARLTVPLIEGEQAVVLLEGDGVLAWRFGTPAASSLLAQVRRGRPAATRALAFDIDVPPVTADGRAEVRRGWLRDRLIDGAKAIVLYFAAEATAAGAVRLLERGRRTGPVLINSATDPGSWQQPDDLRALSLATDRTPHLLMLVHGTFSSTVGGFGELTATPWGQRLLTAAFGRYDAVIGFDHRTMSQSPLDNARDLLATLRTLPAGQAVKIDAISHSRGGLVLRSLTEMLLPGAALPVSVERAIFVAATNHGTELARPDNWETLVDLVTNLSAVTTQVLSWFPTTAAAAHIADEVFDCIGDFVKYLVEVAVTERQVPGIAAMDPAGPFVREINQRQPGQPTADDISCYAVVSDFHAKLHEDGQFEPKELPKRLAFILADHVIDRLMRGDGEQSVPNDLVVDVASMTDIDAAVGGYVKDVLDFGRNPLVYHTNYFLRPETAGRLAQWLHLPTPLAGIDAMRRRGGSPTDTVFDHDLVALDAPALAAIAKQLHASRPSQLPPLTDVDVADRTMRSLPGHAASLDRREISIGAADSRGAPTVRTTRGRPPAITTNGTSGRKPSVGDNSAPSVHSKAPKNADKPAEVFATAEMPRQVRLNRDAVVTVTLAAERIEAALDMVSDQGSFTPIAGETLTVHVIPRRGFDYAAADATNGRAEIAAPSPGRPAILDFTLTANEAGPAEVSVAVRQGAVRMLTLNLRGEVVEHIEPARGSVASSAEVAPRTDCGLCPTMEIFDRRNAGQLQYEFILRAGDVSDRFKSAPIQVDPKAYVDARYQEIESAWLGSDRAIDRFGQRLQAMGGQMFRELFPPQLKEALWRLAGSGDIDDILVHSDEPFLPWEVVFIDDPKAAAATGRGRFFGEFGLCRWLFGATPVCSIAVRRGKARYVIPHYPDPAWRLADAELVEEPMLQTLIGASAVVAKHAEIVALLKRPGSFDLLHFACHGQAEAQQIDSAALLLEGETTQTAGGTTWGKEALLASTVAEFADLRGADGNRPLVVVNACQTGRLGYALTGLGGFATAFLGTREGTGDSRGRAGAFVGALWSVGDQPASSFVSALYRELKADKTIAQAVRVARAEARAAGDGSWLAYAIYAHPKLRVRFI